MASRGRGLTRRPLRMLVSALAMVVVSATPVSPVHAQSTDATRRAMAAPAAGYWLYGADGGVFSFGSAGFYGASGNQGADIVDYGLIGTDMLYYFVGRHALEAPMPQTHECCPRVPCRSAHVWTPRPQSRTKPSAVGRRSTIFRAAASARSSSLRR